MSTPAIEMRDLRKRYGDFTAVDGLSLRIEGGTVFGLLASTSLPVLQAIGLTVSLGTLLSLILSATMVHNGARPG